MSSAIKINQVHNFNQDNRIRRFLSNLAKLAVDSTFNDSLKGVTGPKNLYKIVQERLKHPPPSLPLSNCKVPDDAKLAEEIRIKVEEMMEDLTKLKLQNETMAKCAEENEPLRKGPNEGGKKLGVLESEKKRIFIRSRL